MNARKERASVLALQATIARCIRRAADATSRENDLDRLESTIERQEKQHRKGGARWGARSRYAPMRVALAHFLCRTVSAGIHDHRCGEGPISSLLGVRDDYVQAAILCSDRAFTDRLVSEVRAAYPDDSPEDMIKRAGDVDYCVSVVRGDA